MKNVRIEGIRKVQTLSGATAWAVVGSFPHGFPEARSLVLVAEFTGLGSKAAAIKAAGTNRIVTTVASVEAC